MSTRTSQKQYTTAVSEVLLCSYPHNLLIFSPFQVQLKKLASLSFPAQCGSTVPTGR